MFLRFFSWTVSHLQVPKNRPISSFVIRGSGVQIPQPAPAIPPPNPYDMLAPSAFGNRAARSGRHLPDALHLNIPFKRRHTPIA